ncbi:hypothetical protein SLS53_006729 [Cytospora paraplurivora]|uniref:Protein NO VEIN C-terminal domain-containing protein n=1 Tax=Cytospora paraplurivora TaxID=2898453 RepID=A0AAN9U2S2_9PEZI
MTLPVSRQAAKALVEQISRDHGYLGEEKLGRIDPETRRYVEEALLRKDLMIGSSVMTLAKNLYTSKARFIFELLQNADDNSYMIAAASGSVPFVSFHVHPRHIVLECNEDGFTTANLSAICSVGKSSKIGAQGYIGEKGIGFKSVFMAAWKVHVQSGAFSFSFTHRQGESGMGMISPVWEETREELASPLTRITLHLHETGDENSLAKTRETINEQFEQLEETILLFMKNLKVINVSFHGDGENITSSASYSIERPRLNYAVLKRSTTGDARMKEDFKYFHVTIHQATNLVRNENRTYSETEESTRAYSESQVVLAFPLSEMDIPIIKPQDIFVFLPVRPVGFKFLIQADFVTEASRQDIVKDSRRNAGLLEGIADAFTKAVLQFCSHETLRFQWMRYLPDREDRNLDRFWSSLVHKISIRLSNKPILYCHKKNDLHPIGNLRRLGPWFYDNGQPLFDDGDTEQIISQSYDSADLTVLGGYGLHFARFGEALEWVRQDLRQGGLSKLKSPQTPDSWHTQTAKFLRTPFLKASRNWITVMKQMDFLPLEGGLWVSAATGPIYHAQVEGINIPSDIELRIVAKNVVNTERISFFKDLGMETAPVSLVRNKILDRYPEVGFPLDFTLQTSKHHLEFLYLTQHMAGREERHYMWLCIFVSRRLLCQRPHAGDVYIADENDLYGPWELFRKTNPGPGPGDGAQGYPADFVDEEYFWSSPEKPSEQGLTWVQWFYDRLHVRKYVKFSPRDSTAWQGAAEYLREQRPEKFLGALRIHHQHNGHPTDQFIQCVQHTDVLCRGNRRVALKESYYPTQTLVKLVKQRQGGSEGNNQGSTDFTYLEHFMKMLGVGECTWQDYINELQELKLSRFEDSDIIITIYEELRTLGSNIITDLEKEEFKTAFEEEALIFLPSDREPSWYKVSQCVWSTAASLRGKVSLNQDYEDLEDFFVNFLGVKPVDIRMAIDELKEVTSRNEPRVQEVKDSIWTVNSLLTTEKQPPGPGDLLECRIFPIRYPCGDVKCDTKAAEFFIIDREPLRRSFESMVKLLDFSLDEVVQLRPFTQWTDLQNRNLSACVKEITSFGGSDAKPLSNPNRDIRYRAHALLRIAVHFNSPRTTSLQGQTTLYQTLRDTKVYETHCVTSETHLTQDGTSHMVEGETISLHLAEDNTGLKVYVPANRDDQDYTFTKSLPEKLFEWLLAHPRTLGTQQTGEVSEKGVAAARAVLLAPLSRKINALEDYGIRTVDIIDVDERVEQAYTSSESATALTRVSDQIIQTSVPSNEPDDSGSESRAFHTPDSSIDASHQPSTSNWGPDGRFSLPTHPRTSSDPFVSPSRPPRPSQSMPTHASVEDPDYVTLLSEVIAAGRRNTIPNRTASGVIPPRTSMFTTGNGRQIAVRGATQFERDCKVGAAGELYAFELLSHLTPQLFEFSRWNWQSNMRKYARVHPEYANMDPWTGRETSDITYSDENGALTKSLILGDYLDRETWSGRHPKYFIEVKTTQSSCETPFFMSKAQYQRVRPDTTPDHNLNDTDVPVS